MRPRVPAPRLADTPRMLGLRLGVWLIAAQLRARLIAAPCANLTTAVTLAQCKQLLVTPAVYSSTALCSTELQHWGGIANFASYWSRPPPKAMPSLSSVSSLILGYLKLCSRGASAVRASDQ